MKKEIKEFPFDWDATDLLELTSIKLSKLADICTKYDDILKETDKLKAKDFMLDVLDVVGMDKVEATMNLTIGHFYYHNEYRYLCYKYASSLYADLSPVKKHYEENYLEIYDI